MKPAPIQDDILWENLRSDKVKQIIYWRFILLVLKQSTGNPTIQKSVHLHAGDRSIFHCRYSCGFGTNHYWISVPRHERKCTTSACEFWRLAYSSIFFLGAWFPCKLLAYSIGGWFPSSLACFVGDRHIRREATFNFRAPPFGHEKVLYVPFMERHHLPTSAHPQFDCGSRTP